MKRENQVPASLIKFLEEQKARNKRTFNSLDIFCTFPVRAVRMRMLVDKKDDEYADDFRTAIIPAVDIYIQKGAVLKPGFLRRDKLSFFVAGTRKAFPYGHIYDGSGNICLGTIFVPSAVPERSVAMPIETLFLHNDRNLNHGNSHLIIDVETASAVKQIIRDNDIKLSEYAKGVRAKEDIIKNDQIWNLSADVAAQKPLPKALNIMADIYDIIFASYKRTNQNNEQESEEDDE